MSDGLTRRSFALFKQALDVDAERRAAFIVDSCGEDTGLRRSVESLVAAIDRTGGFLETPVARGDVRRGPTHLLEPGEVFAGYEVISVIGAGGMGTVYEAMQERPRRAVALKVMQRGVPTADSRRRFEFEAEILARLRHPGIAQIYEAGTNDDGAASVPWFAMEHIPAAQSITDYVRARSLDRRAMVALFAAVCDAVQHGHQKGVIHRDLKPGNILVDAKGHPKVIDFGIARLTDPGQAAITQQTNVGQLIGTLNYMSPEQCGADVPDLDVRADVYSLGVVLYELLCGRLPHDLGRVPIVEALRIIQTEAPVRPAAGDASLRGDLEAIVLKALDKDRERRYRSAGALGSDLRHYLDDEMIEARPMTLVYQLQLFARRNRGLIAAATIVLMTIVAGVVASMSFAVWAGNEASRRHLAEMTAIEERDAARWQAYVADIGAASYAYEAGEFQWMRARLRGAPPALRGWEWRFLDALAEPSLHQFVAHDDMVFHIDASSDGRRLATASRDGTIRIWDAGTHELIATGVGRDAWVRAIAFSPDDRSVVSGAADGSLRVWDASTGEELMELENDDRVVEDVDWSPRTEIASASADGVVRLWDGETGAALETFRTADGGRSGVSFSTDGRWLATWGDGPSLTVRDTTKREEDRPFAATARITTVAWSHDDRQIAASAGVLTHVWDFESGDELHALPTDVSIARSMKFFANGTRLAVGSGRAIVLWDLAAGGRETRLRGHEETVGGICFSADERRLYSASWDRTIRVWDPGSQGPAKILRGHEASVLSTAFSPDGTLVASASDDGTVRLWDPRSGLEVRNIPAHRDKVRAVAFAPDGAMLASASYDDTVRLWDAASGAELGVLEGHSMNVGAVAFGPHGALLASGSSDTTITLWDLPTRTPRFVLDGHTARVNGLAFSPDGRRLASASRDESVRIWDVATGEELHALTKHSSDVFAVVFSHDGRRLYSGARDQTVRVWDPATGECVDEIDGHGQLVTSLALSPDGTRLAAGSWFKRIILWDLASGDQVATLTGHEDAIRSVAFDPSGQRIVSGSYDGTVRIWDSAPR